MAKQELAQYLANLLTCRDRLFERLMALSRQHWETGLWVIVFLYTLVLLHVAREYRPAVRLFPYLVGIPVLLAAVMRLVEIHTELLGGDSEGSGLYERYMNDADQDQSPEDDTIYYRREAEMIALIAVVVVLTWLLGFYLVMPFFIFISIMIYDKDLQSAVLIAIVGSVFFYSLFGLILSTTIWSGVLFG